MPGSLLDRMYLMLCSLPSGRKSLNRLAKSLFWHQMIRNRIGWKLSTFSAMWSKMVKTVHKVVEIVCVGVKIVLEGVREKIPKWTILAHPQFYYCWVYLSFISAAATSFACFRSTNLSYTLVFRTCLQGSVKFPTTLYSSPPLFLYLDFLPPNFHPIHLLVIFPTSLNIIGKMILLPFSVFLTTTIFPSPLHNLIFLPSRLD